MAGLIALWLVITEAGLVRPIFLPSPVAVVSRWFNLFTDQGFISDIEASVFRVLMGFVLSAVLAVPMGILMSSSRYAAAALEPLIGFMRYLPVAAFVPLCILWVGLGDAEKVAVIFLGTFFQLVPMVADASRHIPRRYLDAADTLGASRWDVFRTVVLPHSLPSIYDCLRVAMGWAWSYLVLAEIIGTITGIGHVIMQGQRYLQTDTVFAGVLSIGLIGVIFDMGFRGFSRVLFPWKYVA